MDGWWAQARRHVNPLARRAIQQESVNPLPPVAVTVQLSLAAVAVFWSPIPANARLLSPLVVARRAAAWFLEHGDPIQWGRASRTVPDEVAGNTPSRDEERVALDEDLDALVEELVAQRKRRLGSAAEEQLIASC